eukprot:scaffold182375_cov32-Tisochrysis_lutea.AAC.3
MHNCRERGRREEPDADRGLQRRLYEGFAEQSSAKESPERHLEPAARHPTHVEGGVWPRSKQEYSEESIAACEVNGPHLDARNQVAFRHGLLELSIKLSRPLAGALGGTRDEVGGELAYGGACAPDNDRRPNEEQLVEEGVSAVAVCPVWLEETGMIVDGVETCRLVDLYLRDDAHHERPEEHDPRVEPGAKANGREDA